MGNETIKKIVGVIFGSRSVEHDVSIVTAQQVMQALDARKYEVVPIYITRDGRWVSGPGLRDQPRVDGISPGHRPGVARDRTPPHLAAPALEDEHRLLPGDPGRHLEEGLRQSLEDKNHA